MNRKQRRATKAKVSHQQIRLGDIDSKFEIQVESKFEGVVMISASPKGRKIVEDLWPDVRWSTDETFSRSHSDEWLFTHIRVTKLPPHLEGTVPLAFASPDSLAFAVACALHRRAWPLRVAYFTGSDANIKLETFGGPFKSEGGDVALFAEYVPPGAYGKTPSHH
jgi:hypothetical protein